MAWFNGFGAQFVGLGKSARQLMDRLRGRNSAPPPPATLAQLTQAALDRRRRALDDAVEAGLTGIDLAGMPEPGALGLAFSGGGIRSASICLGVAQGFNRSGRLHDFDYMSTVSGGGYFGSFLGSLYLAQDAKGMGAAPPSAISPATQRDRVALVRQALDAHACDREIVPPGASFAIRAPVWWLREHSRYLAPNGPTDLAEAATIIVRNWLAMVYVFAMPVVLAFLVLSGVEGGLLLHGRSSSGSGNAILTRITDCCLGPGGEGLPDQISRLVIPALFLFVAGLICGSAYWFTEMLRARPGATTYRPRLVAGLLAAVATCAALALYVAAPGPASAGNGLVPNAFCLAVAALVGVSASLLVFAAATLLSMNYNPGEDLASAVRRRTTRWGNRCNVWGAWILALAAVDSLARALAMTSLASPRNLGLSGTLLAVLTPAAHWLFRKLPGVAGGKASAVDAGFIRRNIWNLALVAGLALYGGMAVLLGASTFLLVHQASAYLVVDWASWQLLTAIVVTATIVTAVSPGFINLSSLHGFYKSRLTRAYLGAGNTDRLAQVAKPDSSGQVTDNDPHDDLPIAVYQQCSSAAPLHLINVTLNETINRDSSQLVERDRKGVPLVFAPEGILVDAGREGAGGHYTWQQVGAQSEALSLGQLCAISGAAASSGMGSRTTLGGSLALTFANVRLGYWWMVGNLLRQRNGAAKLGAGKGGHFATYYLFSEMTGRYSRDEQRVYLSDGGHFENSAVYELLRRRVKVIVCCDNGADPDFAFDDLENLIRKARIDLGLSVNAANAAGVRRWFGREGEKIFANAEDGDWRREGAARRSAKFAMLLMAYGGGEDGKPKLQSLIIWLKPKLFAGLTGDVLGYGLNNPSFPQETTADQFFDEAQWESYRALGYSMVRELERCAWNGPDFLRYMASSIEAN